jgi:hypothetical protein
VELPRVDYFTDRQVGQHPVFESKALCGKAREMVRIWPVRKDETSIHFLPARNLKAFFSKLN